MTKPEPAAHTAPIVLISPAMSVGSRYYRPLVEAFRRHGWEARALTRRGFEPDAPPAGRSEDWSYADELDDLASAIATARQEDTERPILLIGHSLGGHLAIGHELTRSPVDGVVTVGGAIPHYRNYSFGGLPLALFAGLIIPALTAVFGYLPKPAFGGPGARTLMRDWARMVMTGNLPVPIREPVRTPSFVISLDGDRLAPLKAVDATARRFFDPGALTRWHYQDHELPEGASNHHIRWARSPDLVVDRICSWWTSRQ